MKLEVEKEGGNDQCQNRDGSAGFDPLAKGDMTDLLPFDHPDGYNVGGAADHRQVPKKSATH